MTFPWTSGMVLFRVARLRALRMDCASLVPVPQGIFGSAYQSPLPLRMRWW
ncbi:Uncharacterised protein [Mycobacteroides abscessus subsp. abscessus]|nr:Uncharacterised protein [Mycobacteroides abscessus subsp. abscessus]